MLISRLSRPRLLLIFVSPQVSQLCRGFLQPDPSRRQNTSDGLSLVGWFISRLEAAEARDQKPVGDDYAASTAPAAAATAATGTVTATVTRTVAIGDGDGLQKASAAASCQGFYEKRAGRSFAENGGGGGGGAGPTRDTTAGDEGSRSSLAAAVNVKAGLSEEVAGAHYSYPEKVLTGEAARMLPLQDTSTDDACLGHGIPHVGDATGESGEEKGLMQGVTAAVGRASCEGDRLRELDMLIRWVLNFWLHFFLLTLLLH